VYEAAGDVEVSYPDVVPVSADDDDDDDDDDDTACVILDATDVLLARREFIESLRHEEFGVNVLLNEDGQRLMDKQQQRLGRSLERLSKDLYSKDTHFVLELVQNADDNAYSSHMLEYVVTVQLSSPSVTRHHLRYDDCLADKREKLSEPVLSVLCSVVYYSCTHFCLLRPIRQRRL